jgi:hypothetical protein
VGAETGLERERLAAAEPPERVGTICPGGPGFRLGQGLDHTSQGRAAWKANANDAAHRLSSAAAAGPTVVTRPCFPMFSR